MKISYDAREDILLIEFSNEKVIKDVSHGWNVNIGYGQHGIAEISVLDARKSGFWPLENANSGFFSSAWPSDAALRFVQNQP